jgi:AcrR family transcriptional regulator
VLGEPTIDWQTKRREATRQEILAAAWEAAREHGLASITLRDIAARVGMRAPSLYSHFDSKMAIYDAMFGQAWADYQRITDAAALPDAPRAALTVIAVRFFDFCVQHPARHQLMNLRSIPGFAPSPQAYRPAQEVFARLRAELARRGITAGEDVDLFTALVSGLVDQQLANDPGGERWARLIARAVGMYADATGLPPDPTSDARSSP